VGEEEDSQQMRIKNGAGICLWGVLLDNFNLLCILFFCRREGDIKEQAHPQSENSKLGTNRRNSFIKAGLNLLFDSRK